MALPEEEDDSLPLVEEPAEPVLPIPSPEDGELGALAGSLSVSGGHRLFEDLPRDIAMDSAWRGRIT